MLRNEESRRGHRFKLIRKSRSEKNKSLKRVVSDQKLTLSARGPSLYVIICHLQMLTYEDGPRTESITIFIVAVGP